MATGRVFAVRDGDGWSEDETTRCWWSGVGDGESRLEDVNNFGNDIPLYRLFTSSLIPCLTATVIGSNPITLTVILLVVILILRDCASLRGRTKTSYPDKETAGQRCATRRGLHSQALCPNPNGHHPRPASKRLVSSWMAQKRTSEPKAYLELV